VKLLQLLLSLLLVSPLWAAVVDSSEIIEYEQRIATQGSRSDSLKALMAESEEKLQQLQQQESSNLQQIDEMEQSLELTETLISELNTQVDSVTKDMHLAQGIADSVEIELKNRQFIMEQRLRQMYKSGSVSIVEILFGSASPAEALNKIRFEHYLNSYDKAIFTQISEDQRQYNTELAILSIQSDHYYQLIGRKTEENAQFLIQMDERRELLNTIRSEKSTWETTVKELKAAQQELNSLVVNLIQERDAVSEELARQMSFSFEQRQGTMLWPIVGEVVSSYGKQVHPIHGTTITNKGIGISGVPNESVRAVAPGIIEHIGRLPGYGRVLIINHYGGYLTIYAHLSETLRENGTEVAAGDVIATVGESGSLSGTQLHFEIRENAETLDPLQWLRASEI